MTHLVKFISLSLFFSFSCLLAMEIPSINQSQEKFGEFQSAPALQNENLSEKSEIQSSENFLSEGSVFASQEEINISIRVDTLPEEQKSESQSSSRSAKNSCSVSQEETNESQSSSSPVKNSCSISQEEVDQSLMNTSNLSEEKKSKSSSRSLSRSHSISHTSKSDEKTSRSSIDVYDSESESEQEPNSSSYSSSDSYDESLEEDKKISAGLKTFSDAFITNEDTIEIDDSNRWVRFFTPDYELSQKPKQAIERCAFKLAMGKSLSVEESQQYAQHKELIVAVSALIRPQIVIRGKHREGMDKEQLQGLQSRISIEGNPKNSSKITKVKAILNQKQPSFNLNQLVKSDKNGVMNNEKDVISLDNVGSCIAFNEYNNVIYIGCENGLIYAFDVEKKELVATFKAHKKPVSALEIIKQGSGFVSNADEDATYVWSIEDTRPRIKLEDQEYSKTYITRDGNKIVRSHIGGKSLMSSWVGSLAVKDGIYTIPHGYLQAKVPGDQQNRIAFLYLMKKLHDENIEHGDMSTIKALLDSYVINTFEPPVTKALKFQLKTYLEKYKDDEDKELSE